MHPHTTAANGNIPARIRGIASDILFMMLMSLVPALAAYTDLLGFGYILPEASVTETMQTLMLLSIMLMLSKLIEAHPGRRGAFLLMFSFFTCMLIRENDFFFDSIRHGSWRYPVALLVIGTLVYVYIKERDTVITPLLEFAESKSWPYVLTGLGLLLVMSRLFGSGQFIWNHLVQGIGRHELKTAIQEGMEFYGYLFCARGIDRYLLELEKAKPEKT